MLQTTLLLFLTASINAYAPEGGGNIKFDSPTAGPVIFSHDNHTKISGLKCRGCHFAMFEKTGGSFLIQREKLNKREFCEYCHNGMKGFDTKSAKNCGRCHKKQGGSP